MFQKGEWKNNITDIYHINDRILTIKLKDF